MLLLPLAAWAGTNTNAVSSISTNNTLTSGKESLERIRLNPEVIKLKKDIDVRVDNDSKSISLASEKESIELARVNSEVIESQKYIDAPVSDVLEVVDLAGKKEQLEIEKLKFEVAKLKKETAVFGYSSLLQTGTLIAAILAAVVSFWSAWRTSTLQSRTLQDQRKFNKQERVAQMVGELGSERSSVRLATVQSLNNYDGTVEFICNMIRLENDSAVIRGAISSLNRHPQEAATVLNGQSKLLLKDMLNLGTKLISLGVAKDEVATRICTTKEVLREWSEESEGVRTERDFRGFLKLQKEDWNSSELISIIFKELSGLLLAHNNTILAIESIIQYASQSSISLNFTGANLQGIILDNLELSNIDLSNADLTNASLRNVHLNDSLLFGVKFHSVNLNGANLSNSAFINCEFKNSSTKRSDIKHAYFGHVKFYKLKANRCIFDGSSFNNCIVTDSDFRNSDAPKVKLKDCIFYKTKIDTCKISELTGEKIKLSFCNIENNRLRRSELIKVTLFDGKYKNLKMRGSHIRNSKFVKVNFIKHNGENPRLKSTKFDKCDYI